MMKITNTPPIKSVDKAVRKKTSSASGVDFKGFLSDAEETQEAHETQATQGVNNFLFLQEVGDDGAQRREALEHGKDTIRTLEELHRDLLLGRVPASTLQKLESLVAKKREGFVDPQLAQLLSEIELRAAVEIAKLEKERDKQE